jgi:hypothetical protein
VRVHKTGGEWLARHPSDVVGCERHVGACTETPV